MSLIGYLIIEQFVNVVLFNHYNLDLESYQINAYNYNGGDHLMTKNNTSCEGKNCVQIKVKDYMKLFS